MSTRSRRNAVDELEISSCPLPLHRLDLSEEQVRRILKEDKKNVLYILELESGNYYVGRTDNLAKRIEDHLAGKARASAWVKKHRVVSLCKVRECFDNSEEDALVLNLMRHVDIDRVRGGTYSQPTFDESTLDSIERQLRGNSDRCFKCGKSGHFVKTCPQKRSNAKTSSVSPRTPTQEITATLESLHIDSGKAKLNRSYERWNEREEEQLRRYVQLKWTDKQIAEKLERSETAIKLRKQKLGMG
jgi:predicted GIY-YIG superfamily endonuclease